MRESCSAVRRRVTTAPTALVSWLKVWQMELPLHAKVLFWSPIAGENVCFSMTIRPPYRLTCRTYFSTCVLFKDKIKCSMISWSQTPSVSLFFFVRNTLSSKKKLISLLLLPTNTLQILVFFFLKNAFSQRRLLRR